MSILATASPRASRLVLVSMLLLGAACASAGGTGAGDLPSAGAGGASGSGNNGGSGDSGGSSGNANGGQGNNGGDEQGGSGGDGGTINVGGQGQSGATVTPNTCKSSCGPTELCDPDHLGFDDDCDGQVDEDCTCVPGQSHWCFKGDPSNRFAGACQDGVERCTELSAWGPCVGGKHALDGADNCLNADLDCVDIKAPPFAKVKLNQGTAKFSKDADPGSESYKVSCPAGVSCPAVANDMSSSATFQPLQSGEYGVTYSKKVNGETKTCNYALFVGAAGLRVELTWDNLGVEGAEGAAKGPDLDLHLHRNDTTTPWSIKKGSSDDCYFGNCRIEHYNGNETPVGQKPISWFSDTSSPLNWSKNSGCYNVPQSGGQWAALNQGCHNPRLDTDTFSCDATKTDPNDPDFCSPENINVDDVPNNAWFRVGVHYNGVCITGDTHPVVTVYCGGGQVARIGSDTSSGQLKPSGFSEPVTFTGADCGKKFWVAADVYVKQTECSIQCTVKPLYSGDQKPLFLTPDAAESSFGPPYPAAPLRLCPWLSGVRSS